MVVKHDTSNDENAVGVENTVNGEARELASRADAHRRARPKDAPHGGSSIW